MKKVVFFSHTIKNKSDWFTVVYTWRDATFMVGWYFLFSTKSMTLQKVQCIQFDVLKGEVGVECDSYREKKHIHTRNHIPSQPPTSTTHPHPQHLVDVIYPENHLETLSEMSRCEIPINTMKLCRQHPYTKQLSISESSRVFSLSAPKPVRNKIRPVMQKFQASRSL